MHRILLLGANGKLGRMLRRIWSGPAGRGHEVHPVSRRGEGLCWSPGDPVGRLPDVETILALWGVTSGSATELAENAALAGVAMDLGAALGARAVLHMSSAAVYDRSDALLTEDATVFARTGYGAAKRDMETRILSQSAGHEARQIILRIGSVAGAESLFGNLKPGGSVTLDRFGDGRGPERSYIAPQDLARVCLALAEDTRARGVFNVAAPRATPMEEIALAAGARIHWRDAPAEARQAVRLDTARLGAFCALSDDSAGARHLVDGARATGVWP